MKNNRTRIAIILAATSLILAAAVALIAVKKANAPVTITLAVYSGNNWGVPEAFAYEIYDRAKELFESRPENRNVRIKLITGTLYRDYSEWFAQLILKGQEPDLFLIEEDDFNIFASIGILENLSPLIARDKIFDTEMFYQQAVKGGTFAGQQHSLPIAVVPSFLIVNKTLLMKEGIAIDRNHWDWEQFYRICKTLTKDTDGDGKIDRFGVYGFTWQNAFYTDGQTLFSKDGTHTVFNDNAMSETIEFLKRIYRLNPGVVIKDSDFDSGNAGFKAFNLSEYRAYSSYPYRILKYSNFEWEVVPFPSGPRGQNLSKLYSVQIGMSSRSRHKKEAFEFLKFITANSAFQREIWNRTNMLPANKYAIADLEKNGRISENDRGLLKFISENRIMENLYIDPDFKWYADMDSFITQQIFQIVAMDRDIRKSVPELRADIEKRLAELRR